MSRHHSSAIFFYSLLLQCRLFFCRRAGTHNWERLESADRLDDAVTKNRFVVQTYNALERSLASNCIPWVMTFTDESLKTKVEAATGSTWKEFTDEVAKGYYKKFHRNSALHESIQSYMRVVWCETIDSAKDVHLSGLHFQAPDVVSYTGPDNSTQTAMTMRGVLREKLGAELGNQVFAHIHSIDNDLYDWHTRSAKLESTAFHSQNGIGSPDIVALQEYDFHFHAYTPNAISHPLGSFALMGRISGYGWVWFLKPQGLSGNILFYDRKRFQVCRGEKCALNPETILKCGESSVPSGLAYNYDMMEHWHPINRDGSYANDSKLMNRGDRRSVGIVRLQEIDTNRRLLVVVTHLMTESRDKAGKNAYPGEVRASELATIRSKVQDLVKPDEAVIFMGDMNTDAKDVASVFSGDIQHVSDGTRKQFNTDLKREGETGWFLNWKAPGRRRQNIELREASSPTHRWGAGVGLNENCTSRNAKRVEWLDYIWYQANRLKVVEMDTKMLRTPNTSIPNVEQASDHLPVRGVFEFVDDLAPKASQSSPKKGAAYRCISCSVWVVLLFSLIIAPSCVW